MNEQVYECNYTYDLRQKRKRWKDGRLVLSSSNIRILSSLEENAASNVRHVWQGKLKPDQLSALDDEDEVRVGNIARLFSLSLFSLCLGALGELPLPLNPLSITPPVSRNYGGWVRESKTVNGYKMISETSTIIMSSCLH